MATKSRAVPGLRAVASGRFTWDVASCLTLASDSTTVQLPGVIVGDSVIVTPDAPATGFSYRGTVTQNGTVTLYATNGTSGTVNPASTIFSVMAIRP